MFAPDAMKAMLLTGHARADKPIVTQIISLLPLVTRYRRINI